MASRALLGAPRLNPTQVPTGPVALDRAHPLAAGLGDFLLFSSGQNFAAPAYPPAVTGVVTAIASPRGQAVQTPGNLSNYVSLPQRTNLTTDAFTVSVLFQPISVSGSYATVFDKGQSTTAREMSLFVDTSLNFNYAGVGNGPGTISGTSGMSFGGLYETTLTRATALGSVSLYVNGALITTFTGTYNNSLPSATGFGANISGGGANMSANYLRWATWQNVCLSPSQVQQLVAEPFGMLRPVVRRAYYSSTTGTTNETGTIAARPRKPAASIAGQLNEAAILSASPRKPAASIAGQLNEAATVTANPRKPAASITGQLNEAAILSASPRKPAASIAGQLNEAATVTANPRKPAASIAGQLNEAATVTANPRKPAASIAAQLNEAATVTANPRKPAASIAAQLNEAATVTANPRKPAASIAGQLNEAATLSATPRKPAASIAAQENEAATVIASPRKPTTSIAGSSAAAGSETGSINAATRKPAASIAATYTAGNTTATVAASPRKPIAAIVASYAAPNTTVSVTATSRKPAASISATFAAAGNTTGTVSAATKKCGTVCSGLLNEAATLTASPRKPITIIAAMVNPVGQISAGPRKPITVIIGGLAESGQVAATTKKPQASLGSGVMLPHGASANSRRRLLKVKGRPMSLQRPLTTTTSISVALQGYMTAYAPTQIGQGSVMEGDGLVATLADEMLTASFPTPPRARDRMTIDGRVWAVIGAASVFEGPLCIGYNLHVRGG